MSLSTAQLDPDFARRVDALLTSASQQKLGIQLVSAYRSFTEQQRLYARLKPRGLPVATPGRSCHEFGAAVDVVCRYGFGSRQFALFRQTASTLNITNPVANDPGHFQDTELCRVRREEERGPRGSIARNRRTSADRRSRAISRATARAADRDRDCG